MEQAAQQPAQDKRKVVNDLLTNTFNSVMRIEERALKHRLIEGLSISELHTLVAIGMYEQNTMSVVAARLDVTLATFTVAINKLEKKGFVQRTRSEEDRRQVLVSLTQKGRKALRTHDIFHKKMVDEALSDLNPEEEQALIKALTRVKGFFEEQGKAQEV